MPKSEMKNVESRFAFGKNWASYAAQIGETHVAKAKEGLLKLIPQEELIGRSFLDIGSGSGVHSLAAADLGVGRIVAIDIDLDSVETTRAILTERCPDVPWQVEQISVFDFSGSFDIVYAWGVLHHTGSMWEALNKSAGMVIPGGLLILSLYRRTWLDPFWRLEKRWYANASSTVQKVARFLYHSAYWTAASLTGKPRTATRGMDYWHDLHDWLGGHPYETTLAPEVDSCLSGLGFKAERVFARPRSIGILGSGCDEYVYRKLDRTAE